MKFLRNLIDNRSPRNFSPTDVARKIAAYGAGREHKSEQAGQPRSGERGKLGRRGWAAAGEGADDGEGGGRCTVDPGRAEGGGLERDRRSARERDGATRRAARQRRAARARQRRPGGPSRTPGDPPTLTSVRRTADQRRKESRFAALEKMEETRRER